LQVVLNNDCRHAPILPGPVVPPGRGQPCSCDAFAALISIKRAPAAQRIDRAALHRDAVVYDF
jgi:hypothetical protein